MVVLEGQVVVLRLKPINITNTGTLTSTTPITITNTVTNPIIAITMTIN